MPLVLFNSKIGPYQVLALRARVDQGKMAVKWCSAFPKAPASLEPHHQIVECHIQDTHWGGDLTPLQRCSRCILQLQPTGLYNNNNRKKIKYKYRCKYYEQSEIDRYYNLYIKSILLLVGKKKPRLYNLQILHSDI